MKTLIFAAFLVCAFAAGLLVSEARPVSADDPPKKNQWQYQCFQAEGVAEVTKRSNQMGQQGWELVTAAGTKGEALWCFKRPLWKS